MASNDAPPHTDNPAATPTASSAALIGWRWLALLYDLFPALGLWFAIGALALLFNDHQPVRPGTLASGIELLALWSATGAYAVLSWRHGGQTLGMRPWRLRVTNAAGGQPSWGALTLRYAVATASLLLAGSGFWWAWLDRDRLTWHDRASRTRMRRESRHSSH